MNKQICNNCGIETNKFKKGFMGYNPVVLCDKCAKKEKNFVAIGFYINEIFMSFCISYIKNHPCEILHDKCITKNFDEAYKYAKNKYKNKLVGIDFEEYVDRNGKELTYNETENCWNNL